MTRAFPTLTFVIAAGLLATACQASEPEEVVVTLSARDVAYDTDELRAPVGASIVIEFTNHDSMAHDVMIFEDERMMGEEMVFNGDIILGPDETVRYEVGVLEEGEYFFICSPHPQAMTGWLIVEG